MSDDDPEKAKNPESHSGIKDKLLGFFSREPKSLDDVLQILRDAGDRGILKAEVLLMLERILRVSDTQVREVIIPKAQMVTVKKSSTVKEVLPIVIDSGHSRFPIVDTNENEVVGMLLAKDILKCAFEEEDVNKLKVADFLRPAIFTPQSKRLDVLLREFRVNRNHIAIVIDEYGHVAGLVTIEDVLEQIVGDIEDEYDIDEEAGEIKDSGKNSFILKAPVLIEDFNDHFNADFSDEEFDTIGGLVLQAFGHMPKRGETTIINKYKFKVLHADNRRLYLLEVKAPKQAPSAD